jgi:hypothetical protein
VALKVPEVDSPFRFSFAASSNGKLAGAIRCKPEPPQAWMNKSAKWIHFLLQGGPEPSGAPRELL